MPEEIIVGLETSIVVRVSDGFDWTLTINGESVGTGTGINANQTVTFTPTSAMKGVGVPVVLASGSAEDTDTVDCNIPQSDYGYYKEVTLNTSAIVLGSHSNFLSRIVINDDTDIQSQARADGADIIVTSADGYNVLDYWRYYDSATGNIHLWVRVPGTTSSAADVSLRLYYGNADAVDAADPVSTFQDFEFFYALDSASPEDATGNWAAGTGANGPTVVWNDERGVGVDFEYSSNQYITLPNIDLTSAQLTLGTLCMPESFPGGRYACCCKTKRFSGYPT